jgi:hypothetical protein
MTTIRSIRQQASGGELSTDERAELARLRAATAPKPLTFKVGDKGGVSVYGMGRFPVTLYVEQWDRLIAAVPELAAYLDANRGRLRTKGEG